jgi:hypothetical protein
MSLKRIPFSISEKFVPAEDANARFPFCDHERKVKMSVRTHDTLHPKEALALLDISV